MARSRRRPPAAPPAAGAAAAAPQAAALAPSATTALPEEAPRSGAVLLLLAAVLFLAPALGAPHEELLQDTLKSIIVAVGTLCAALLFCVLQRGRREPLRWHDLMWLPLALCGYALASMYWSHTYLAAVEAIRWFVFSLLLWLVLNVCGRERLAWLAWGIHGGALVASLWAVLQFWVAFDWFPQGPNPASTFVNRNFFAEFAVCTLPFGLLLLARARPAPLALGLAASSALVITAILMTGTRAALIALWVQLLLVVPLLAWRCHDRLAWSRWPRWQQAAVPLLLLACVLALGSIPTGNSKIIAEERGLTALQRGLNRTQSIGPADPSLGIRMEMWRATLDLVRARPITGVGAGAWESEIPRYQPEGAQVETDYYVHNEFLQLVAEYGLAGWGVLVLLFGYLALAGWRTWRAPTPIEREEQVERALLLSSLLAFLIVSCIGFPWRLAATGALFATCLGALAASDARLARGGVPRLSAEPLRWSPRIAQGAAWAALAALGLAVYICERAVQAEYRIVSAAKLALTISASGNPNHPRWDASRREMLQLIREGIDITPHYRKITPVVADELARWGDWVNATWIWESVLASRPHVVALIVNVARGYTQLDQQEKAMALLERARKLQPQASSVRSLEVLLLARAGHQAKALQLAREAIASGRYDFDTVNILYVLARRARDWPLAMEALELRMRQWPQSRPQGQIQKGQMLAGEMNQPEQALDAFRLGLALAAPGEQAALAAQIPPEYRARLGISGTP